MKQEMIWATKDGISLHVERLDQSARFRIQKGEETIAMAEIEDWKFIRVIRLLGGEATPIRKQGKTRLKPGDVDMSEEGNCI